MALTLPKAKTLTVTAKDDAGQSQKIEITTKVGTMIPTLTVPSILQLIRNTSVDAAQNIKQNTRYVAETKAGSEVLVSSSDGKTGTFTKDPRTMSAEDLEIIVAQFTPQMNGKKYRNIEWDANTETVQDALARKMASYISVRRTRKSFQAIEQLITAADAVQAEIVKVTAGATTFALGAHSEAKAIATADEAYSLFASAISNFQRIGTQTAKEDLNKNYGHTEGINKEDMFAILSPEFEALILGKPGVFASESGNELFKKAGIKNILGVQTISNISIPANVHFILITTGMNGAYGYEDVDGGEKGNMIVDPDWSFGRRLDLKDTYTMGVVLPFQIFVGKSA